MKLSILILSLSNFFLNLSVDGASPIQMSVVLNPTDCKAEYAEYNEEALKTVKNNWVETKPANREAPPIGLFTSIENFSSDSALGFKCNLSASLQKAPLDIMKTYSVKIKATFATDVPNCGGLIGLGGNPTTSVHLKAGVFSHEPIRKHLFLDQIDAHLSSPYYKNFPENTPLFMFGETGVHKLVVLDKGNQASSGEDMKTNGTLIDVNQPENCDSDDYRIIERWFTIQLPSSPRTRGDHSKNLWALVIADSGFMGRTNIVWQKLDFEFTEISTMPDVISGPVDTSDPPVQPAQVNKTSQSVPTLIQNGENKDPENPNVPADPEPTPAQASTVLHFISTLLILAICGGIMYVGGRYGLTYYKNKQRMRRGFRPAKRNEDDMTGLQVNQQSAVSESFERFDRFGSRQVNEEVYRLEDFATDDRE